MRKTGKKLIGLAMITMLAVSLMTGCGSKTGSTSTGAESAGSNTAGTNSSTADNTASTESSADGSADTTSADSSANGELTKVVVLGEFDPQISGQQIIAKEKGFFEEEGLDVDLQLLTDPSVSTTMVAANEAQFYSISNYQAINLVDKGSEVCLLAPVVDAGNTQCVVGGPNLKLTSAKDLEGKKMGYTDGAGVIVAVKAMCDDLGVDFNAIKLVNLQASDMLASLESGDIDFFAAWEPWGIKAEEFGGHYLFTGTKSYLPENEGDVSYLNFEVCIDVSKSFLNENPKACEAYVRAMMKATDYINSNLEDAADIIGKQINLDKDTCVSIMKKNVYKVTYDQTFKDSCDSLAQYMADSGLNTGVVKFDSFANTDILSGIDSSLVSFK
ncbi:ABC transporter substrate-binding protein [Anaerocolumna sp. MB42-C2]|uniref:ABC transporter substrate-binding protein n=1 Tax=Anaerocolumna sp. MB42-C2 TaxID=3070997 RepID=UPI0027E0E108|nr:ABC transporter substrate-binding protein [Anaerocolumna sp. MB42-C2]WMJ86979.1 ABC transporter substrate-binding protein [Anaerocolumna sp. MB42-C2]